MMDGSTTEFDYIIVGAGPSAMGLLYGLLSSCQEDSLPFSCAIVERGSGPPHDSRTMAPNCWHPASSIPSKSVSLLKSTIGKRVIDIPVGIGLGGTTNVNACLFAPPAADDFASWPSPWKQSMMKAVHDIQNAFYQNGAVLNSETPWHATEFPSCVSPLPVTAAKNRNDDYARVNYYDALVEPILSSRPKLCEKLKWFRSTVAQRLLLEDDRVVGIECESTTTKRLFALRSRRDVIVCAGAIETPALLMVSGIGMRQDLRDAGIHPLDSLDLSVGHNLQDHVMITCATFSWRREPLAPSGIASLGHLMSGENRFQFMLADGAGWQILPHIAASLVRVRWTDGCFHQALNALSEWSYWCIRTIVWLGLHSPVYLFLHFFFSGVNVILLNPRSRGRVTVRRKRAGTSGSICHRKDVDVIVEPGYLADGRDVGSLWEGWQLMEQHPQYSQWINGLEVLPGPMRLGGSRRTSWFHEYCHWLCLPYFHWCGTCAMGEDGNHVVTSDLGVRNLKGIRICDASVFPMIPSGPTALTCAALGHLFSTTLTRAKGGK